MECPGRLLLSGGMFSLSPEAPGLCGSSGISASVVSAVPSSRRLHGWTGGSGGALIAAPTEVGAFGTCHTEFLTGAGSALAVLVAGILVMLFFDGFVFPDFGASIFSAA